MRRICLLLLTVGLLSGCQSTPLDPQRTRYGNVNEAALDAALERLYSERLRTTRTRTVRIGGKRYQVQEPIE